MMKKIFVAACVLLSSVSMALAGDNSSVGVGQAQSGSSSSVNINGGKNYRQVGAAIAPGLAVGAYSCSGSVSAGVGGSGFGVAFGSTVMDRDCNTRENAKVAQAFGMDVARRVLCNIKEIREAAPQCQAGTTTVRGGIRGANRTAGYPVKVVADNGWGQR